jgi:putative phosphoesterase
MKIALISDIHSNVYAFEAVLREIHTHSVDLTVFLGDLVYGGLYPRECLSVRMNITPLLPIQGNAEGLFDEQETHEQPHTPREARIARIHRYIKALMTDEDIQTIKTFPLFGCLVVEGLSIGFYHGSPRSYSEKIYADDSEQDIREKFKGVRHDIAGVGHTHHRMHRILDGLQIINPGAIGYAFDGDNRAGYGILTIKNTGIHYAQHNVEYPIRSYIHDLQQSDLPHKDDFIEFLQTGGAT